MQEAFNWHQRKLAVDTIGEQGFLGKRVKIGYLDSGASRKVSAIAKQIANFKVFSWAGFETEDVLPYDNHGHGTFTAGTILNIAPEAEIYSGLVLEGGNVIARVLQGLKWLLDSEVDIINLPLGIPSATPIFKSAIQTLQQRNSLVIASIGNLGAGKYCAPGYYSNILSVGAADENGVVASFSSSKNIEGSLICEKPDIIAYGVGIKSYQPDGSTCIKSGTSMASAVATGIAALLAQAARNRCINSMALVKEAIVKTAHPLLEEQSHRSYRGLINPVAALHYIEQTTWDDNDANHQTEELLEAYIDPRLLEQCRFLCDWNFCAAVLVFHPLSHNIEQQAAEMKKCIETTEAETKSAVQRIVYIPEFRVVILRASVAFIMKIIHKPEVLQASAADIDFTLYSEESSRYMLF